MQTIKTLIFVILVGWGSWTGLSAGISYFFALDFSTVYLTIGVTYVVGLLILMAKVAP